MANQSIKSAFQAFWYQVVNKLSNYATIENLNAHINDKANPHEVELDQLGVAATVEELNYMSGATGNIQGQLDVVDTALDDAASAITANTSSIEKNAESISQIDEELVVIKGTLADLLYEEITISSFKNNIGTVEVGSTVDSVTLTWTTSKAPSALTLDNTSIDASLTGYTYSNLGLTPTTVTTKTYTLKATDERDYTASKTTSIYFYNGIYYGVGSTAGGFDSAFVTGLTKKLQNTKAYDFTVNPTAQYIYYAVPTRLGTVSFKVGGFEGGFESPETVSVTNSSGYTENYYVYRSTNTITGSTTVDVA